MARRNRVNLRERKDALAKALKKGKTAKALEVVLELSKLEPADGQWPGRAADLYRKLGDGEAELTQRVIASKRYADGGFLLKAVAACKLVLELDPEHGPTLERLAELSPAPTAPVASAPEPSGGAEAEGSGLSDGQPLEDLVLTEVVDKAKPIALGPGEDPEGSGIAEIPLDFDHAGFEDGDVPLELETDPEPEVATDDLARVPLFSSLAPADLQELALRCELIQLDEGAVLFEQGDLGDALYVVCEGAVVPIAAGADGEPKRMAVLEEGAFFGEVGLISQQPRNARIEALVPSRLLAIDRRTISALIEHNPETLQVLLGFLRDRLMDRLVHTSRLLSPLPRDERRAVADCFRFVEIERGTIVVEQGKPSPGLTVLLAGKVDVVAHTPSGAVPVALLEPGHVFGEMSLVTGDTAVARCTTTTKCWALFLSRSDVEGLMANEPRVGEVARALAEERRAQLGESLRNAGVSDQRLDLV